MTTLNPEATPEVLERLGIKETSIPGLLVIERPTWGNDPRGEFQELARFSDLKLAGVDFTPAQWARSETKPRGLRGLHAEPIQKLVTATSGQVLCCLVDTREDSPMFGRHEMITIGPGKRFSILLPVGVANSFLVTGEDTAHYQYIVSREYEGRSMPSIKWNDPELAIPWPISDPILSKRDEADAISFQEYLRRRDELNKWYLNG